MTLNVRGLHRLSETYMMCGPSGFRMPSLFEGLDSLHTVKSDTLPSYSLTHSFMSIHSLTHSLTQRTVRLCALDRCQLSRLNTDRVAAPPHTRVQSRRMCLRASLSW